MSFLLVCFTNRKAWLYYPFRTTLSPGGQSTSSKLSYRKDVSSSKYTCLVFGILSAYGASPYLTENIFKNKTWRLWARTVIHPVRVHSCQPLCVNWSCWLGLTGITLLQFWHPCILERISRPGFWLYVSPWNNKSDMLNILANHLNRWRFRGTKLRNVSTHRLHACGDFLKWIGPKAGNCSFLCCSASRKHYKYVEYFATADSLSI